MKNIEKNSKMVDLNSINNNYIKCKWTNCSNFERQRLSNWIKKQESVNILTTRNTVNIKMQIGLK